MTQRRGLPVPAATALLVLVLALTHLAGCDDRDPRPGDADAPTNGRQL